MYKRVWPTNVKFSRMNYVCGVGRTKFGVLNMGLPELAYEAMFKALEDGDFSVSDLDLIYIANFLKNTR